MSAIIKPKRSETSGAVPGTSDLVTGEIAVNILDKKIFVKNTSGTIVTISDSSGSSGSSGVPIEVEDEGTSLSSAVTKINFAGTGVTATEPSTDEILVTIPNGGTPRGGGTAPDEAIMYSIALGI